jgi:CMP-N-acetylneuraminic acid synthetase
MKTVAIIPARGGSTRLLRKNIRHIWGKPMIYWVIKAAQRSKYITDIYVTSEDQEILDLAKNFGAKTIVRPNKLADNTTLKQHAIVHALQSIENTYDLVVSLQSNSPELKTKDVDSAIDKLLKHDRNEIITVDKNLVQHGAFRVWKYDYAFTNALSYKTACYQTNYVDIHNEEDLKFTEENRKHD